MLKATCAHELTHTWVGENVPADRKQRVDQDAIEGFCELVAYLLLDSQQEENQMKAIRRNFYTRGQVDLFIEAERRFGFNQVREWMQYGVDAVLHKDDLNNVRDVNIPRRTALPVSNVRNFTPQTAPAPDSLALKAVIWKPERPMAIINGRTFEAGQQFPMQVGKTNLTVRCLAIGEDSVRVRIVGSGEERELRLPNR